MGRCTVAWMRRGGGQTPFAVAAAEVTVRTLINLFYEIIKNFEILYQLEEKYCYYLSPFLPVIVFLYK